ncbi:MAG: N-acetylmuramoyl-L-alanine amidase [Myxococcaceae bacterium]
MILLAAALIVLDPGHSVSAPGATGVDGKVENVRNENMVDRVARALDELHIASKRTRTDSEEPSLHERAKKATNATLLVSIHHDAVNADDWEPWMDAHPFHPKSWVGHGFSIHVRGDSPESVAAAIKISDALIKTGFEPSQYHLNYFPVVDAKRGIYDRRHLGLLNSSKVPTVLVECGFLTHPTEVTALSDPETQKRLARAIAEGIAAAVVRPEVSAK